MLLSQPQNENNRKNFAFLFAKKKRWRIPTLSNRYAW